MIILLKWNKKNSSCAGADDDEKCYCQNEKILQMKIGCVYNVYY